MPLLKSILSAVTIGIIISSCGISTDKPRPIPSADTLGITKALIDAASELPDTTNQYIYDFMKMVIAERQLKLGYGLAIEPEQDCDLSSDDAVFLKTLLIEKKKKTDVPEDATGVLITLNELPKCFTKADVENMLQQKKAFSKFTWDNSRLGFNADNHKNWYCFSVPLFSRDRKKAIMMIRNLCPGLCGTGSTAVFINKNGKWTSIDGGQWIH
jgi:hypothetical protein